MQDNLSFRSDGLKLSGVLHVPEARHLRSVSEMGNSCCCPALVRPDHYVFAVAREMSDFGAMSDLIDKKLCLMSGFSESSRAANAI